MAGVASSSSGGGGGSGAASSKRHKETGFLKTFPSDLDDAAVHRLMLEIKTQHAIFRDYTTRDLKVLSSLVSALKFEAGDKVAARGETASWLAVVLKGTFASVVHDERGQSGAGDTDGGGGASGLLGSALRRGDLYGELELFEAGSLRRSDLVAATPGVLGVLTYEDVKLVSLASVDLHMRLMHTLSASSIRKLRQQQQMPGQGGAVIATGSATPRSRSRRSSLSAGGIQMLGGGGGGSHARPSTSGSSSPLRSPTPATLGGGRQHSLTLALPGGAEGSEAPLPATESRPSSAAAEPSISLSPSSSPSPSLSPLLSAPLDSPVPVGDEAAVAAAIAGVLQQQSTAADGDNKPAPVRRMGTGSYGGNNGNGTSEPLELLFRTRMKRHPNIKPRRIESDAWDPGSSPGVAGAASPGSGPWAGPTGGGGGVMFPPLASPGGAGTRGDREHRASFPGPGGSSSGSASPSLGPLAAASSPAPSLSSLSAATDKTNHNYVLYALRNKLAKQEETIDERDAALAALRLELRVVREESAAETRRANESEERAGKLASDLFHAEEKRAKAEGEMAHLRGEVVRKSMQVEQLEAAARLVADHTAATVAAMHEKLIEHGEIIDESGGILAAANAHPNATGAASTNGSGAADKGKTQSMSRSSSSHALPQSNGGGGYASKYTSSSRPSASPALASSTAGSGASGAVAVASRTPALLLADNLSSYTNQYDSMVSRLRDRLADQERSLLALHKWKSRAQEFATTWDVERKMLRDKIKAGLQESETLRTQKDSYKILLKIVTVKLFMQHSALRKLLRGVYRRAVGLTTEVLLDAAASGGPLGAEGSTAGGRAPSVQTDSTEQLLVRVQQKMNDKLWNSSGGGTNGSGVRSMVGSRGSGGSGSVSGSGSASVRSEHSFASSGVERAPPPPLKALVSSLDDELIVLHTGASDLLASKTQWQQTAAAYFQRNIELTQLVAAHDTQLQAAREGKKELAAALDESRRSVSTLQSQLDALEAAHKTREASLAAAASKGQASVRARREEAGALFDKGVALRRRVREGELAAELLRAREARLLQRNEALHAEQRRLTDSVAHLRAMEASLTRSNPFALGMTLAAPHNGALLPPAAVAAVAAAAAASAGTSGPATTRQLGPLVGSPHAHLHRPLPPHSQLQSQMVLHNNFLPLPSSSSSASLALDGSANGGAPPHAHAPSHAHSQSTPSFWNTAPVGPVPNGGGMQYAHSQAHLASASSLASVGPGTLPAAPVALVGGGGAAAVLATIRARAQPVQGQPHPPPALGASMTSEQWAALSAMPPHLLPLSARPAQQQQHPASLQPRAPPSGSPARRRAASGSQSSRVPATAPGAAAAAGADAVGSGESKQQRQARKAALAAALHRRSLDQALYSAARAGLGRGMASGAARKIRSAAGPAPASTAPATAPAGTGAAPAVDGDVGLEGTAAGEPSLQTLQESKENSAVDRAASLPPLPPATAPLRHMMQAPAASLDPAAASSN